MHTVVVDVDLLCLHSTNYFEINNVQTIMDITRFHVMIARLATSKNEIIAFIFLYTSPVLADFMFTWIFSLTPCNLYGIFIVHI